MRPSKNKKRLKHFCILAPNSLEDLVFCLPTVNLIANSSKNRSVTLISDPSFSSLLEYAFGVDQVFSYKSSWKN
jgi:hypothetical protein